MTYIKINNLRIMNNNNNDNNDNDDRIYLSLSHDKTIIHTNPIKSINNQFIWTNEYLIIKKNDYLFIDIYKKNIFKRDKLINSIQINLKYDFYNYNILYIYYEIVEIMNKKVFDNIKLNYKLKEENLKLNKLKDKLLKDKHRLLDKLLDYEKI